MANQLFRALTNQPRYLAKDNPQTMPDSMMLFSGLMRHFADRGDVVDGLRWSLPQILNRISAVAGSLFLHRSASQTLDCIVCHGPVDITGLKVPFGSGIVGRVFANRQSELTAAAHQDKAHFKIADQQTGFQTRSTATVPVRHGRVVFGVLQAVNRDGGNGAFSQQDLTLLELLASALAMAMSNLNYAEKAIKNRLLKNDVKQAKEIQDGLFAVPDSSGFLAGCVVSAGALSGDFYDHLQVDGRFAFCQGDVAGKGITASLTMTRSLTLFRHLARQGLAAAKIASAINTELCDGSSSQFVTFCCGWFDPKTSSVELINCGHGAAIMFPETTGKPQFYPADMVPLGIVGLPANQMMTRRFDLAGGCLFLMTDGISEATFDHHPLDEAGLIDLLVNLRAQANGHGAAAMVDALCQLFTNQRLQSHDDATLLVIDAERCGQC